MKLQEITGLSNADPIHRWLGMVDRFLGEHDWLDTSRRLSRDELAQAIWVCLGHPVKYPTVEEYCLENFQQYLQESGEPVLAEIVYKLRRREGEEGMDKHGIRCVVLWLVANIDYLKEKYLEEGNKPRRVTAGWEQSSEG